MNKIIAVISIIAGIGTTTAMDIEQSVSAFMDPSRIDYSQRDITQYIYSISLIGRIFLDPAHARQARRLMNDPRWALVHTGDGNYVLVGVYPHMSFGDPDNPHHSGDVFNPSQILYLILVQESMKIAIQPKSAPKELTYGTSISEVLARIQGFPAHLPQTLLDSIKGLESKVHMGAFLSQHPEALQALDQDILFEVSPEYPLEAISPKRIVTVPSSEGRAGLLNPDLRCYLNATLQTITAVWEHLGGIPPTGPIGISLASIDRKLRDPTQSYNIRPEIEVLTRALWADFPDSSEVHSLRRILAGTYSPAEDATNLKQMILQAWIHEEHTRSQSQPRQSKRIPPDLTEFWSRVTDIQPLRERLTFLRGMPVSRAYMSHMSTAVKYSCGCEFLYRRQDSPFDGIGMELSVDQGPEIPGSDQVRPYDNLTECIRAVLSPGPEFVPRKLPGQPVKAEHEIKCHNWHQSVSAWGIPLPPTPSDILILRSRRNRDTPQSWDLTCQGDVLWGHTMEVPTTLRIEQARYRLVTVMYGLPGHYTAAVMNPSGEWYYQNDSLVESGTLPKNEAPYRLAMEWTYAMEDRMEK
ncbi:MAG: hypothetical protein LBJ92_02020 [Holosporales bacterium]|jgi:hypothetical protein|nr:hypothetical protein [Holosporales bacterium]